MQIKILFEDNHLLAVAKPSGLATQPSPTSKESLEDEVKAMIKARDQKKGGVFLHAVHRLDKATSGIVLFAKTQKALSRLMQAFREKTCEKEYLALVPNISFLKKATLPYTLRDFLFHDDHKAIIVPQEYSGAKEAILTISSIEPFTENNEELYLLTILLHTGRYHQIRAQLSFHGAPIVGDIKYGSTIAYTQGIALQHSRLAFSHPTRKERVSISLVSS